MNQYDIAFDLSLNVDSFDLDSDVLVEMICEKASESPQFSDVHAGGFASKGLLKLSAQVQSISLPAAISRAYSLIAEAINDSGVQAEIRNQTAIAV
jgi:hypothetical protein